MRILLLGLIVFGYIYKIREMLNDKIREMLNDENYVLKIM